MVLDVSSRIPRLLPAWNRKLKTKTRLKSLVRLVSQLWKWRKIKKALEAQWDALKVQRAKEVVEWERTCQILQGQDTAKKDLPKRLPPPRKAELQAQTRVESSLEEMPNLFIVPGSLAATVQDSNEDTGR
jgi:hypothetical protein